MFELVTDALGAVFAVLTTSLVRVAEHLVSRVTC